MEDQQPISSIIKRKRKRVSESSPASGSATSPKSKKRTIEVTEDDISVTMPQSKLILSEENPQPINQAEPESQVIRDSADEKMSETLPPATYQLTLPITTTESQPTTNTTTATQTPPQTPKQTISSPPSATQSPITSQPPTQPETTVPTLLLSSDSTNTSGSLRPDETKEERIARKMKERRDTERSMILKINAEAEAKEEEERKMRLKEQSDTDREYMLKLSGEMAEEREREMRIKREQEESDAKFAKLMEDIEKTELQREAEAKAASIESKKKGGAKSSVDRLWNEIDRKKYAERMIGRSNPAPITKVNLKKPKNQSQAQLLIHRGLESQAITLDQVCKLHREEWNEIRLAVSHSSSAAKKEVLDEIDRLFQKMVALQLLRPEDTVIFGEEIVQPPSPRYRSGPYSLHRVPNISRLNLSIPDGVPRVEGTEVTEGEKGLVYRDPYGVIRFQREAELEKIDHEQLVHLIRAVSLLDKKSYMRQAVMNEALARQFRFLPSTEKYELAEELDLVKKEEMWKDL